MPYITHPVHTAWILQRAGVTDESLLAAALLHDVVEDCGVSVASLQVEFSTDISDMVTALSERKLDAEGRPRPWEDRKRDHLAELQHASLSVRQLTLADKLHNLETIAHDLESGVDVWSRFNAPRERLLWYYSAILTSCRSEDPVSLRLAADYESLLGRIGRPGNPPADRGAISDNDGTRNSARN